jgi:hypothetical protein
LELPGPAARYVPNPTGSKARRHHPNGVTPALTTAHRPLAKTHASGLKPRSAGPAKAVRKFCSLPEAAALQP